MHVCAVANWTLGVHKRRSLLRVEGMAFGRLSILLNPQFPCRFARSRFMASSSADDIRQEQKSESVPKRYHISKGRGLDILAASLPLVLRMATGTFAQGYSASLVPKEDLSPTQYSFFEFAGRKLVETSKLGPRPKALISMYDFEGCPYCRKVREVGSVLDLDVLYYPCPKNGPTFRPKAAELGGKQQFPYMVDPNTGVAMYDSDHITKYLVDHYGNGKVPIMLSLGPVTAFTTSLALAARGGKGTSYSPAKKAEKALDLWAYEGSPFCKIVRERLVELELPHVYHSTPRGSSKRDELVKKTGTFQVPYLEDQNTGVRMFESSDIVDYLNATYASSSY